MVHTISNNGILITVDKSIYNIDVLYKCFYWYGANFDVAINELNEQSYQIELIPKSDVFHEQETLIKIKRDLVDFKLRDIVTKETQTIRELIIAKAFAYYDEGETPQTELSDPVGFDPNNL